MRQQNSVQRRPSAAPSAAGESQSQATRAVQLKRDLAGQSLAVQMAMLSPDAGADSPGATQAIAAHGVRSGGGAMPHANAIQRSFGHHDIGSVRAHTGGDAAASAGAIGAEAFAMGDNVAFAGAPSLHTSAHEAAHVVQQRAGVQLSGGVGAAGDAYEQHADRVADRVVAGESAEGLLDEMAPGAAQSAGGAAVQRKEMRPNGLVAELKSEKWFSDKLAHTLPQGGTVESHVKRVLTNYDAHFKQKGGGDAEKRNEAMRIAAVLQSLARDIAYEMLDPSIAPLLAQKIGELWGPELRDMMGDAKNRGTFTPKKDHSKVSQEALDMAIELVGDDPLNLYMRGKVPLADAAFRIRDMAEKMKLEPEDVFQMLSEQFQMELGAFNKDEIKAGEKKKDTITQDNNGTKTTGDAQFELGDLLGETSTGFFCDMVQLDKKDVPKWKKEGGLDLTKGADKKLESLKKAVLDKKLVDPKPTPKELKEEKKKSGDDLSDGQRAHFARLRREEGKELKADASELDGETGDGGKGKSPQEYVVAKFEGRYGIDNGKAKSLLDAICTKLTKVPLTITSVLANLFAERDDKASEPKYGSKYKSEQVLAQKGVPLKDLAGKESNETVTVSGAKDASYVEGRGENYMRWRRDKDERETGYHGLSAEDLPVFGAMNPNFGTTKGGNANLAEWDKDKQKYTEAYGKNYYGDTHMLLKDSVRARSTFIGRGKKETKGRRIERLDMTLLVYDMVRLWMWDYIDELVAQATSSDFTVLTNMDAEVHIYGGLDLASDVSEIYCQDDMLSAKDGPGKRLQEFCATNNIKLSGVGKQPNSFNVKNKGGITGGVDTKKDYDMSSI